MKNISRVVITGATGVLGTAILKKLIAENIETYVVCRPGSKRNDFLPVGQNIHKIECDMTNIKELPNLVKEKCDVFFHLAWLGTQDHTNRLNMHLQNLNCGYCLDAVDVAHALGCTCFIGAGSQSEYGRIDGVIHPYTPEKPISGYGMAKLCAGQMTRFMCNEYGMRHIWVRVVSTYGINDNVDTLVSVVIRKLLMGERPALTLGEQDWDYLYAADAAEAFYSLALSGKANSIYVLGSGKTKKLREYMESIRDAINPNLELGIGEIPYYKDQVMHLEADISNLTEDTGWTPKVSFEDGISETINYWKQKLGV